MQVFNVRSGKGSLASNVSSGKGSPCHAHIALIGITSIRCSKSQGVKLARHDYFLLCIARFYVHLHLGAAAREEMMKSRLPSSILRRIWALSDIDQDGQLDMTFQTNSLIVSSLRPRKASFGPSEGQGT